MELGALKLALLEMLVLVGSIARAFSGMGAAALIAPLVSFLLPPKDVIALSILVRALIDATFLLSERPLFEFAGAYASGAIGFALGLALYSLASQRLVGAVLSLGILALALLMLVGARWRVRRERELMSVAGFAGGFMSILTGVAGPQVALALINQGRNPVYVRRYTMTFVSFTDLLALISLPMIGGLRVEHLEVFALLAPGVLVGYWLGAQLLKRASERAKLLERIVLALIASSSLAASLRFLLPWGAPTNSL
ncbi:MAG: sulfite exporter TauE/SafE family protein [Fervidicoccaceae archaeon]